MYRKYIRTRDWDVWSAFKSLRNLTTFRLREAKKAHFATVCRNTNQPKRMWTELKNLMKKQHRKPIQALSSKDGEVTDDLQMAKTFNKYFTGLFDGGTTVKQHRQTEGAHTEGSLNSIKL